MRKILKNDFVIILSLAEDNEWCFFAFAFTRRSALNDPEVDGLVTVVFAPFTFVYDCQTQSMEVRVDNTHHRNFSVFEWTLTKLIWLANLISTLAQQKLCECNGKMKWWILKYCYEVLRKLIIYSWPVKHLWAHSCKSDIATSCNSRCLKIDEQIAKCS